MKLDSWQEEILEYEGDKVICTGRQVGKSTIIGIEAAEFAVKNPKTTTMIIASVERQAFLLFDKVFEHLHDNHRKFIKKGKDRPTKSRIQLTNGSQVLCLPTGVDGHGIRGYTIHRLYADEAAHIFEQVWHAILPSLAMTGGDTILLSTPHGSEGYFYDCYRDPDFKKFEVNTEWVQENRPLSDTWTQEVKNKAIKKRMRAKETMSSKLYDQEYMGKFISDLMQLFPDKLIKKCMLLSRSQVALPALSSKEFFLGVDVARMGSDETTYEILERMENGTLYHRENIVKTKELTTMTSRFILHLDTQWNFKKIGIDDGGLGAGVFDQCLENPQTRRKVVAINNLRKAVEHNFKKDPRKRKLLKEELYDNLLRLMEQGKIQLLDDPNIFQSLKSVLYEYGRDDRGESKIRIYGNYTHIAEGLIRAAQVAKQKIKKLWVQYI